MVEEILKYPDDRINIGSGNVRFFDEELWDLIENLKDTSQAHDSRGLAAIQIAVPLAVVVVKDDEDQWIELINPRIIRHEGNTISKESTLYLPDIVEEIPRYELVSLVYQDRDGEQKSLIASGAFGYLVQRKVDYIYGGTFMNKIDKEDWKETQKSLAEGGLNGEFNACPTFSKREYFKSAINKLLFFETLSLAAPFFIEKSDALLSFYHFTQVATILIIILIISYILYAKYEVKKYASCTGCQVVSITAVAIKYFIAAILLFTISHYWLNPS